MKYFTDSEFHEDGVTIIPISIAVVAEDGREFYRCNRDYDLASATDWLREHVLPQLPAPDSHLWASKAQIATDLVTFIGDDPAPEFWGYYADYDWVVIAQLFGRMIDLPKPFPKFCLDLKQYLYHVGNPRLPKQEGHAHSALHDARWVRDGFILVDRMLRLGR